MARREGDDFQRRLVAEEATATRGRGRASAAASVNPRAAILRWTIVGLAALALTGGTVFAYQRTVRLLDSDERFALVGPDDDASTLEVAGSTHASHRAIEQVFAGDFGHSVYSIPLSQRRERIQSLDWIQDATVARIWPNHVRVTVKERVPVAFVTVDGAPRLIDNDGKILPQVREDYKLPVLLGIHAKDSEAERRDGVHRMARALTALGDASKRVSEIDVADADNLKVSEARNGKSYTLMLGDRNFAARYKNYVSHIAEIEDKLPEARTFDLRIEDRITAVEEASGR